MEACKDACMKINEIQREALAEKYKNFVGDSDEGLVDEEEPTGEADKPAEEEEAQVGDAQ